MDKPSHKGTSLATSEEVPEPIEGSKPKKTPLILKILAILLIVTAVVGVPFLVLSIVAIAMSPFEFADELGVTSFIIAIISIAAQLIGSVVGAILGINLLRNKRRNARHVLEVLIVTIAVALLCTLMLEGINESLFSSIFRLAVFIAVAIYIDPTLSEERKIQRKLRDMETRDEAEKGILGRDMSGKGYLKLDFLNIFWIFVIGCIVGVIVETIYYAMVAHAYQDRAGMLYGPFSPIYGFGAILMTVALNRLYNKPIVIVFVLSALIGGTFEYLVSWFMEFAFGIVAWDYSGTFLSIDGRTNGMFMFFWGVLGCVWIKFLLPYVLKLVNLIPWSFRYTATTVCAVLMITNGVLTLAAFDSWFQRQAQMPPSNALEEFCNEFYDDQFMEERFQTMSIDPTKSTRT